MRNWLPVLPSPIQEEFMSTYDIVKQAGEIEGFQKGEQAGFQKGEVKGEHKGEQKGELKNKLETLVDLLVKAPKWKNKTLAEVTRLKKADVKQLKKALKKNKNSKFKALVLELFQAIPHLKEKDFVEIDVLAISLFAQYQAAKSKK